MRGHGDGAGCFAHYRECIGFVFSSLHVCCLSTEGSRQPVTAQSAVVGTEPRLSRLYRAKRRDRGPRREDAEQTRSRSPDEDKRFCCSSVSELHLNWSRFGRWGPTASPRWRAKLDRRVDASHEASEDRVEERGRQEFSRAHRPLYRCHQVQPQAMDHPSSVKISD